MPFCPECGERIRHDQSVCSGCRGDLQTLLTVVKGYQCPRCGETVGRNFSYCSRCGFLLAREDPLHEVVTEKKSSKQGPTVGAILIIIIVVVAAFAVTDFLRQPSSGSMYPITIDQVQVHYSLIGAASAYSNSIPDSILGPYNEYSNSQFVIPLVIPANPTPLVLQVSSIIVATAGFTLVSSAPSSNVIINPGSPAELMLTIRTPVGAYSGSLYIIIQLS
jgi:predicted RNA-binding Zn-ribbon protein involved in translation (DUF1610 family)